MAKQTVNIGTIADDGTGDNLRTAFGKANANFTELYDFQGGFSPFGISVGAAADAAALRDLAGVGSLGQQAAGSVAITGGSIAGLSSLGISASGSDPIVSDRYNASSGAGAGVSMRRARGAVGAPSAVLGGDVLGGLYAVGYKADGSWSSAAAAFYFNAAEDFTASGLGTLAYLALTNSGTTSRVVRATFAFADFAFAAKTRPGTDNSYSLGDGTYRWSVVYAATGAINTSDAREKQDVAPVDDALLDAWADVQWVQFRWIGAVLDKGDGARIHHGAIAQQVRDAIDARLGEGAAVRFGLLCFDSWDGEAELRDEEGLIVRAGREAGDRWGLRYDQCFAIEAAYQRREIARQNARIAALEAAA
ncbi:MAG: tail fiber domain-containing protein [Sphingobium sp.]